MSQSIRDKLERIYIHGGRVLKNHYYVGCLDIVHVKAETVLALIALKDHRELVVGTFYQVPDNLIQSIDDFECYFEHV